MKSEIFIKRLLFQEVNSFFKDVKKTKLWFKTDNPLLGNISPDKMIEIGRSSKLIDFIDNQIRKNDVESTANNRKENSEAKMRTNRISR